MKNIVIVGGSHAGIATTHRIFQKAAKTPTVQPFKVTLVSRDSHFYWNLAAPRAAIAGNIADDELFQSIPEGFEKYGEQFEFILGTATSVNFEKKTLCIKASSGLEERLEYDSLILATGAHTKEDMPFKSRGSTESTKEALHQLQRGIAEARTIVLAGAGPTGVELAGELASAFGNKKKIVLLTNTATVLDGLPPKMTRIAEKYLHIFNVEVRLGVKVVNKVNISDNEMELTLTNGEKLNTNMYIPTYGVVPNSSYLPTKFLNEHGFVEVGQYLDVAGMDGVFAVGEVSALEHMQFLRLEAQTKHMADNMVLQLVGKSLVPYKKSSSSMMGVSVSNRYATGHFNSWILPSFLLTRVRKQLFVDWLPGKIDGSRY